MDKITALIIVNIVLWLGIGTYVAYIAVQQKALQKKIDNYISHKNNLL